MTQLGLEYPTRRRSSSFSASTYKVVTCRPQDQYAPEWRNTALIVFSAMIRSEIIDQFST